MPGADVRSDLAPQNGDQPPYAVYRACADRVIHPVLWLRRRLRAVTTTFKADTLWPELLAICCFLILPWVGIAAAIEHEYGNARSAAVLTTANLAQVLEESTRRTIGQIDYILLSARALRAAQGEHFDFHDWVRTQTLPDKMTAQISMADRDGRVMASTIALSPGVSIADRPHFRVHLDPAEDALFISKPVIGRVSGVETIQFSRKLISPDGDFAGIMVLSLASSELARFYDSLNLGKGFVAILAPDGTTLARGPRIAVLADAGVNSDAASVLLQNHPAGSVALAATAERTAQIASFRRLRDYPLIVLVGLDTDSVFRSYKSLRDSAMLSGLGVSGAVGLIGFFWIRQKQRSLASRRALTVTLDTISQGILMIDRQGGVSVVNPRVRDLLGRPGDEPERAVQLIAARAGELVASHAPEGVAFPDDGASGLPDNRFEATLENGSIIEVRTHPLPDGGFVQTYTDVTEQRQAHAQVFHLAHHDSLTGLANRVALMQAINAIVDTEASPTPLTALVMVDLDGFKAVNDTLGHDAGDHLLIETARRLKALVRGTDLVARLGGDEFVMLLPGLHERAAILPLADRVLRRLADPIQIEGKKVNVGASLGIAFHPHDGLDADTWFKHADMALYSAKNGGRGIYRCFDDQLSQAVTEHHLLEHDLRRALEGGELEVHFQPKFNCQSLAVAGFEALARWRHPTRGYVSPAVFIRVAEDSGLINRLGRWVLQEACERAAAWPVRHPVAVNVSVLQLRHAGLNDYIEAVLAKTGLGPEHLELEVTESIMAEDDPAVLDNLQAVKAMGVQIALDDFGTGYSSLSHLRRFAFDKIKIDRSFVQGQADDPGVRIILEAILDMCQKLGLATVGEGIETTQQLDVLRDRGCTEVQGYMLARPLSQDQVEPFLRSRDALASGGEPAAVASR
jgi:diguanylate cyclase (GGDEF)-like protein